MFQEDRKILRNKISMLCSDSQCDGLIFVSLVAVIYTDVDTEVENATTY